MKVIRRSLALLLAALIALGPAAAPPARAAISSTTNSIQYAGNGATTAFSFPYPYFVSADLVVTIFNTSSNTFVSPAPVLNGAGTFDYTVAGVAGYSASANNVQEFGSATITFNTAPPGGDTVILTRALSATQTLNLLDNAKFTAGSVNAAFDRLTMLEQQLGAQVQSSLQAPTSDPAGLLYVLPPQATRASAYLCFDSSGNVTSCPPASGISVSSPMAPVVGAASIPIARGLLGSGAFGDTMYTSASAAAARALLASGASGLDATLTPLLHGMVRLSVVDTTHVKLSPYNGQFLRINGAVQLVPSAGVTALSTSTFVSGVAAQALGASTTYLVYAFMNSGTMTLDFWPSGGGHLTDTTAGNIGIEVRSNSGSPDSTRTLVAMVRTNGSSQFQDDATIVGLLNWFNRQSKTARAPARPS